MITLEEYHKAEQLLVKYKVCAGCMEIVKAQDTYLTTELGQYKYWCPVCYEKIKDD